MTDHEMRRRIAAACARLDAVLDGVQRGVRKVLLPAALGTGLALGGGACGGARTVEVDSGAAAAEVGAALPEPNMDYAAPFPEPRPDAGRVDVALPEPNMDYAAPFPDPAPADLGADAVVDDAMDSVRYGTPFP